MASPPPQQGKALATVVCTYASAVLLGIALSIIIWFLILVVPVHGKFEAIWHSLGPPSSPQSRFILSIPPSLMIVSGALLLLLLVLKEYVIQSRPLKLAINLLATAGALAFVRDWFAAIYAAQVWLMGGRQSLRMGWLAGPCT